MKDAKEGFNARVAAGDVVSGSNGQWIAMLVPKNIWKLHFVGGTKFSDPIGEFRARGKIKKLSPSHRKIRAPYRILMPSSERTLIARQTFHYPPHIISLTELQIYATQFVDILLLAAYVLPTKALVMLINNK